MRFLTGLIFLAMASFAADVTGTWNGTADTENGKIERIFHLKQDGSSLTGDTVSEMIGKSTIENGKVEGDAISFTIKANFQGNEIKLNYKGTLRGDELRLHVETSDGGGFSADYIAKRTS